MPLADPILVFLRPDPPKDVSDNWQTRAWDDRLPCMRQALKKVMHSIEGRDFQDRNTRARGSTSMYRSASQERFARQKRRDTLTTVITISKMRYN